MSDFEMNRGSVEVRPALKAFLRKHPPYRVSPAAASPPMAASNALFGVFRPPGALTSFAHPVPGSWVIRFRTRSRTICFDVRGPT